MVRSSFGSFGNIRWPLVAGLVLFIAGAEHLTAQPPANKATFKGKWDGRYVGYEDNKRQTGEGEYQFREDDKGRLTVTVTWWDKGQKKMMELTGERLGHDTLRMEGEYKGTAYRYIGGMAGDELKLHYESLDKKSGKSSGFGLSRLTRPK